MLADGRQSAVPLASLSAEDQAWIRSPPTPASNGVFVSLRGGTSNSITSDGELVQYRKIVDVTPAHRMPHIIRSARRAPLPGRAMLMRTTPQTIRTATAPATKTKPPLAQTLSITAAYSRSPASHAPAAA
jgi:hypothetical protein